MVSLIVIIIILGVLYFSKKKEQNQKIEAANQEFKQSMEKWFDKKE